MTTTPATRALKKRCVPVTRHSHFTLPPSSHPSLTVQDKGTLVRLLAIAKTDLANADVAKAAARARIDELTLQNHHMSRQLGELKHKLALLESERDDIAHQQMFIQSILAADPRSPARK